MFSKYNQYNGVATVTITSCVTSNEHAIHLIFSRLDKDEDHYEQSSDVRSQLRFFEHLERMEKQRKDEQEREILMKAAKVRPNAFLWSIADLPFEI